MKRKIFSAILAASLLITACSRNSDDTPSSNSAQTAGQIASTAGSWRVTLFVDSGNNETADFAGYSFVFNSNGTITATKNGVNQNGTWTVDASSNKFIIDLGPKIDSNKPLG